MLFCFLRSDRYSVQLFFVFWWKYIFFSLFIDVCAMNMYVCVCSFACMDNVNSVSLCVCVRVCVSRRFVVFLLVCICLCTTSVLRVCICYSSSTWMVVRVCVCVQSVQCFLFTYIHTYIHMAPLLVRLNCYATQNESAEDRSRQAGIDCAFVW